jgi:hypothetical protein
MELTFDQRGNLLPYKKIKLELDEFRFLFVEKFNNSRRNQIFKSYQKFLFDFSTVVSGNFVQWIDGSFVTSKEHPNDIDFVTFINHEVFDSKEKLIHENFRLEGARKKYGVDAYTIRQYPENHAKYMLYQSDLVYWLNWFSNTKKTGLK